MPDLEQEKVDTTVERFRKIIEDGNGTIEKHDLIGKRRLAYEIDKIKDGIYTNVFFTGTTEIVNELDRVMRISDDVIRHLIINDVAS